ncbi:MAG: hypothetical protein JXA50_00160 [Deltaproteobacteria bacterium]|nr:hypothetical protein [Deltaproteobacteria bacterium]
MRKILCLLIMLVTLCTAAYGQDEEEGSQSPAPALQFDQDQLLIRLATLKPFKPDKGQSQPGYTFVVTQEDFRNSLNFLADERVDQIMENFGVAVAFSFKDDTQFLILTQWQDHESAKQFIQIEQELWRFKDKAYQEYIKRVVYEEIDVANDEKALLTRKTLAQAGQKQDVTTFVSARKNTFFECTLIGDYNDREVKKLILQIWKHIESEEKKEAR